MGIVARILGAVVVLAMLIGLGAPALVTAQEEVTVSINAPAEVVPESNFTATVDISQVENFDACNYDISFNATVLRLDNVTSGNIGSTAIPVDYWTENVTGRYTIVQNLPGLPGIDPEGSPPVTGSGYLAVLHFHVVGSDGQSSEISLSNGAISSNLADKIPAIWVGDSVHVAEVDITPPTVTATSPVSGATGVAVDTTIQVTFSESMNTTSAQGAFLISPEVDGSFNWAGNVMTFAPAASLDYNTTYTVTIGTAAQDLEGISLTEAYVWSFTTALPPPPVVITNAATDITSISATLNGRLDNLGGYTPVNVSFEWGTTSGALDQVTTPPQAMTSTDNFSAGLSGLSPNTPYYFMAKATADGVTVYGDELSFTTPEIYVCRELPLGAAANTTFDVTITFTAPQNNFNSIVLHDEAPTGWQVTVNKTWCTPTALTAKVVGTNVIEYGWLDPVSAGTSFTVVYKVTVPEETSEGGYPFPDGWLVYYIGGTEYLVDIYGESNVMIRSGSFVSGKVYEVNCEALQAAFVKLYKDNILLAEAETTKDGLYQALAPEAGTYTVIVSKLGFREETQTIEILELGAPYELDFTGDHGIIPKDIGGMYFAKCMNLYLFGTGDCSFGGIKFARIMNAYLFPIID